MVTEIRDKRNILNHGRGMPLRVGEKYKVEGLVEKHEVILGLAGSSMVFKAKDSNLSGLII